MKKKIGVLTFHRALNFGAVFQAYALNKVLLDKGFNVEVIDYYSSPVYDVDKYQIFNFSKNENIIVKALKVSKRLVLKRKKEKKLRNFEKFVNTNIIMSKKITKKEDLIEKVKDYSVLISGSDQVWNKVITKEDKKVYNLSLFKNVKKVAYAASLGEDSPAKDIVEELNNEISDYSCIGVREESLKKLINNKDAQVVLDPTLLLPMEKWNNISKKVSSLGKEKYIFVYMLEINNEIIEVVNTVSKKLGIGVINIGDKSVFENEIVHDFNISPSEFLTYINNAEFVVTNSFHGVCMSIVFQKQFFAIPHKKRGSRQKDLLKKLNLEFVIINKKSDILENIDNKIDYKKVNNKLNIEREKSLIFLLNSLDKKQK